MKKNLFILAVAGLALASCSSDETTASLATSQANEISFRPLMTGVTRAATDITASNLASFNVTAYSTGTNTTAYINDVTFTEVGGTYTSTNKYYWPTNNLDFYAYYWDNSLSGVSKTNYRTFNVTPAVTTETAGNQVDLVYAALKNKGKTDGATGLPINFSHIGSKIALKVTHSGGSNANVYFEVKAWAVGYLDAAGTFTFPDYSGSPSAETTAGSTLSSTYWSNNDAWATDKQIYRSSPLGSVVKIGPAADSPSGAVTSYTFDEQMILVPQGTIPAATKYQATTSYAKPEGSYVAVQMAVKSVSDGSTIQSETWAMWPVSVNWEPGKKYTYNVTIDNGGYFEANTENDNDALDPVLKGSVIYFAGVTVSDWDTTPGETNVTLPASNLQYGTSYTFNNANLATGTQTMTFNIGGLAGSKYIKVTRGGTDGTAQVASSTPTLDTTTAESATDQVVTVTLNANTGVAKTMTITIQEYDDSAGTTASGTPTVITINQAAS